jgi:C-methyltransferase C-terminal domain
VLLLEYHALAAILDRGQWNALRHGHFAYYSTTALTAMLAAAGLNPRTAWRFDLYGGTVLLAATRDDGHDGPDEVVTELLAEDARVGVRDPGAFSGLQREVDAHATALHAWLAAQRSAGRKLLGYGAASRAVALLCQAHVGRELLPAVVDASPAKQGLRMPGTDIPVAAPARLAADRPDTVLLFVPDLMAEVRDAFPEVETSGGRWVDAATLASGGLQQDA